MYKHVILILPLLILLSAAAFPAAIPVVDLDAEGLPAGTLASWTNNGSAGGSFSSDGTTPLVESVAEHACVTFDGSDWMKSSFTAPSTITGSHAYTVAVWILNPSIASEEAYLTWAQRGTTTRCAQFNYGYASGWGATTHWASDLGFANLSGNSPAAGMWHFLTVTYDGTTETVYVDGFYNNSIARSFDTWPGQPVILGSSYTDASAATKTLQFSGSIASLRVYSEALTPSDVAALYGVSLYKISGTVRVDGTALAGATVCLKTSPDATNSPGLTTATASDGSYSFSVQPGTYYVAAKKAGYQPKPTPDVTVTVADADVPGKDFSLSYVGLFAAQPFDLTRVRLLPGLFKSAEDRDETYLLFLQPDRFLHMFRQTAGLATPLEAYGGWESESCELRGHAGGHYLSALAQMYAATGNAEYKTRADYMVAELAKCQAAMPSQGYNAGYLSAYPESFIDRVETRQGVWAPYYTLHKVMAGLYDAYYYCGNQQALTVLSGMASWCKNRCDKLTDTQMQSMLNTEFGGMGEVLANLYGVTGNPDHLAIAQRFDKRWFTDPLVLGTDDLPGIHSNTHIPQVIAAARLFEVTQQDRYAAIADNFFSICTSAHCYPTGGTSNGEYWQEPNRLSQELADNSEETCCTYNMLKLANHVISWNASAATGDYIERALLNHILTIQYAGAAQPDLWGTNSYYTSFIGGHWKHFGSLENSMWCCTGTGFEDHALYGQSIYFHSASTLYVNLFIASTLNWAEKGVTIAQTTTFPEEQGTTITVGTAQPVDLSIKVRIPYWATNGVEVLVNGIVQPVTATPSSFVDITRTWSNGDTIRVNFPMSLRLEKFVDDQTLAAVFYGPVMLSGALGTENFTPSLQWGGGFSDISTPALATPTANISDWIKPVAGQPLTFRTQGAGVPNDFTLLPFYKLFDQRYNLYWRLMSGSLVSPISDLRDQPDGTAVDYAGKSVTLAPRNSAGARSTNYFYIEEADRSAGIRVQGTSAVSDTVNVGDTASISGTLKTNTTTHERYIELKTAPVAVSGTSPAPLGMTAASALADAITPAKLVTVAAKITSIAGDRLSMTLNDGFDSDLTAVVVTGIALGKLNVGDMASATGVISWTDASKRALLLRRVAKVYPPDLTTSAWYKFDETSGTSAADSSGNNLTATLVNGPTHVAGKFNNGVNLDGSNDYVSLPGGVVSAVDDFTIATWVKMDNSSAWNRIFDFGTGTGKYMFLTPLATSGSIRYAITIGGSGSEQQINGTAALPTGSWQHVAVTLSGTTGILYVNGVEVGRTTGMSLKPSSLGTTSANYIGRSQFADPYFDGVVDDFRIYPRALSAVEVAALATGALE